MSSLNLLILQQLNLILKRYWLKFFVKSNVFKRIKEKENNFYGKEKIEKKN